MRSFFFGDGDRQLYGVYGPPSSHRNRSRSVLLCYPLGHEYVYAHRTFSRLAQRLAADGFHVLRFDYYATGDSAGGAADGTVDQWRADVRSAAAELRELSGTDGISLLGLRAGATLAAMACQEMDGIRDLLLWDPIVDGRAWLEAMERLHSRFVSDSRPALRRFAARSRAPQLLGFPYPARLRQGLAGLALPDTPGKSERSILLVSDAADTRLTTPWERGGTGFEIHTVPGTNRWCADSGEPEPLTVQVAGLDAVVGIIAGGNPS